MAHERYPLHVVVYTQPGSAGCDQVKKFLNDRDIDYIEKDILQDLTALNGWRNVAAHQGRVPAGTPLTLGLLQGWRNSCDGLATSLDDIMYHVLRRILRRKPW